MRFVTAVQKEQPQDADRLIRELFQRLFIHNEWITSAEALEKICKKLGLPTSLIEATNSEVVKKTLKDNTDEALAEGAFGVPYVLLKNQGETEHFFGVESLPQLCHSLGVEFKGPLNV
ncbi:unnamed protein product [Bursaphelenchus xylophilus]|nr:unnamed protein product [Bursaphelenchus xylophilus]CAG9121770.1 unnamed protein product [Bursaphelenchus xylophilus]